MRLGSGDEATEHAALVLAADDDQSAPRYERATELFNAPMSTGVDNDVEPAITLW